MKQRLSDLLARYGALALGTYLTLFALVFGAMTLAIGAGWRATSDAGEVSSTAGTLGTLGAAYAATQLTKPFRILATVFLTPLIARVTGLKRGDEGPKTTPSAP